MLKLRNPQSLPAEPGVGLATVRPVIDIAGSGIEGKMKFVRKIAVGIRRTPFKTSDETTGEPLRHDGGEL